MMETAGDTTVKRQSVIIERHVAPSVQISINGYCDRLSHIQRDPANCSFLSWLLL